MQTHTYAQLAPRKRHHALLLARHVFREGAHNYCTSSEPFWLSLYIYDENGEMMLCSLITDVLLSASLGFASALRWSLLLSS